MKIYFVKKLGSERVSYNLRASVYAITLWIVIKGETPIKAEQAWASPCHINGVFGYKAKIDGKMHFFPSEKDATTKRHIVKPDTSIVI
jgi:hypothetical protein